MVGGVRRIVKKGLGEMGFNKGGGSINWFPGHMAAATRAIRDRLKLADLVIEVRDSRVRPLSPSTEISYHNKFYILSLNLYISTDTIVLCKPRPSTSAHWQTPCHCS